MIEEIDSLTQLMDSMTDEEIASREAEMEQEIMADRGLYDEIIDEGGAWYVV